MQSMSDYYSAIQLRSDRWSALREASSALSREPEGKHAQAQMAKIDQLFDSLSLIEAYWAFPGVQALVFSH
jgi:arginine decarboxylase